MNSRHCILLLGSLLLCAARLLAQTSTDLNHGLSMAHGASPGSYTVRWWGKNQRKFYLKSSQDLINWTYLPVIEWGSDLPIQWNLATPESKAFVRLEYEDPPAYPAQGTSWGPGGSTFNQGATQSTGTTATAWPLATFNSGLNSNSNTATSYSLQSRQASAYFSGRHVYVSESTPQGLRIRYEGEKGNIEPGVEGPGLLPPIETNSAFHDHMQISDVLGDALSRTDASWLSTGSCSSGGDISQVGSYYTSREPGDPGTTETVFREFDTGSFSESLGRLATGQPAPQEHRRTYWFARRVNDGPFSSHTEIDGTVTFIVPKGGTASEEVILSTSLTGKAVAVEGACRMLAPPILDFGQTHYHYLLSANIGYIADPLPVNTDFEEKKIGANGFALPDCADTSLIAAQGTNAGKIVTEDMWTGFFGLNPVSIPNLIRQSSGTATVTISRVNPDPEDPQAEEEEGEVRMHIISQAVANGSGPFSTQAVHLGAPGSENPVDMSAWYAEAMVGKWKTSFEGIKPGLITLKFTYVKGAYQFEHQQRFEVCTRKTTAQWLAEVREQILLQTGGRSDLDSYLPYLPNWQPAKSFVFNTTKVAVIYEWYGQLFKQYPDKMDWMGIARLVGAAVYGGMSESQAQGGSNVTIPLQGGQVLIYRDMAWIHRAYIASGLGALQWVAANDNLPANGVSGTGALNLAHWTQFDAAFRSGNFAAMQTVTTRLVEREQGQIIVPMWDYLSEHHSGVVSVITSNAKNVVDPASPDFLNVMRDMYPDIPPSFFTAANYEQRVDYSFDTPVNAVFHTWWGNDPLHSGALLNTSGRLGLVNEPFAQRATLFSAVGYVYPP
ncbi:MAG: hypothetical protein IPK22_09480 [Verrucomicrobiaceae bacterium]|nr:hypothetical protein [Verrucomicrobiaceae bacterium]